MNKDIERLQGTWQIVDLELEGQKSPAMGAKITIQGNRFITTGMGPQYEGNLEVDEAKSPKLLIWSSMWARRRATHLWVFTK